MNAQQLRNSILQMAIQGKLVPQDPNDEPASVLLEKIAIVREQKIKEGDVKRSKCKVINMEEVPFPAPNNWSWTKINDIAFVTKLAGFEYSEYIAENLCTNGIPLFKGKNVQNGRIIYDFEAYIPESLSDSLPRSQVSKRCLLTPYVGSIGNIALHDRDGKFHLGSNVGKIEFFNSDNDKYVLEEFALLFLRSNFGYQELSKHKKATAQESISIDAIRDVYFPLPPLAEQKRIVAKLEELLPLVEQYGKAQDSLDALNADLPRRLRQSILQEAIQGKLVPQDPNEGTAGDLITSYGVLPSEPDEDAFCIPTSWSYIRFGDIVELISGTSYGKGDVQKQGLRVLRGGNIQDDKLVLCDDDVFLPFSYRSEKKNVQKGDIIIVASTGSKKVIGKPALIEQDYPDMQIGAFLRIIRLKYSELLPYIWLIFRSPLYRDRISTLAKGTNINNIKEEYITDMLIPLPPLSEQHRIVAKIEELFNAIDKIN